MWVIHTECMRILFHGNPLWSWFEPRSQQHVSLPLHFQCSLVEALCLVHHLQEKVRVAHPLTRSSWSHSVTTTPMHDPAATCYPSSMVPFRFASMCRHHCCIVQGSSCFCYSSWDLSDNTIMELVDLAPHRQFILNNCHCC